MRIQLNDNEKDLLSMIEHVKLELKVNRIINEELGKPKYDERRVLDLLNLKDLLLTSLLKERTK